MAAAVAMDREPEVARFIDSYKFDQDMATKRDKYGGGTSLPLNSDGYEERQQRLREERHRDWLVQQDKPKDPVYYRVGTPEQGFPGLGEYEKQRKDINLRRQKEYNEMLKKQRHMEQQKFEARRRSPPRPAQPAGPQMDYNLASEQARAEERRAYQDYMKAKEERYWAMRGRPVTPPGGLNIGNYDRQLKETAQQKKKEYKEMLDQQQREHMYLRARQEPEMAVLDRNAQPSGYLASKPPPGPSYGRGRDEPNRQTPSFWNDGRQAQSPRSLNSDVSGSKRSSANVPVAYKIESQSRPIPERPRYGQPPYPGAGVNQKDIGGGQVRTEAPKGERSPVASPLRSPLKPVDRELLKIPPKDDERPPELSTPLAFKTESHNARYGQPVYPETGQHQNGTAHENYNPQVMENSRAPVNPPPRSPEKPANPEWLKVPLRDDERSSELGTPMAFKTDMYSRQPAPGQEQVYSGQPSNALEQSYQQQLPLSNEQHFRGPPFSRDGQKPPEKFEKYGNDMDGLYGRPWQSSDRPRSRRSLDADRRQSPRKRDGAVMPSNQLSPRRMKNALYEDSEEVSAKRREASKERQKEYNEFLKQKAEERRRHDEQRQQQQMGKPAEVVKNPYYSSDDYEKFQREIQRKQGEEYRDFLAKQKYTNPARRHDFVDTASGPYGGLFHGLGEHGNRSDMLNKERQQDYNDKLDQQFGKDRPSGRPNWVKEPLPNSVDRGRSPMKTQPPADQYQQMLDEKRREEANRRRFEDPEYQDRLAQGRDRGEAGPRYGY